MLLCGNATGVETIAADVNRNGSVRARDVHYLPSCAETFVKVALALLPIAWIAVRQTTTMRANMTAYSTAVGPSSETRKCFTFLNKVDMAFSLFLYRSVNSFRGVEPTVPAETKRFRTYGSLSSSRPIGCEHQLALRSCRRVASSVPGYLPNWVETCVKVVLALLPMA